MMKKALFILAVMFCMQSTTCVLIAGEKDDARIAYVLKNLRLDKEKNAKFKPLLTKFYKELSDIKAPRKALKDKYAAAEEKNKLTDAQCDELFNIKQKQDAEELALRKKYYGVFKTVLTVQEAYNAMKLSNDKIK